MDEAGQRVWLWFLTADDVADLGAGGVGKGKSKGKGKGDAGGDGGPLPAVQGASRYHVETMQETEKEDDRRTTPVAVRAIRERGPRGWRQHLTTRLRHRLAKRIFMKERLSQELLVLPTDT